jgi:ABC-type transporter Mla MlaB component
MTEKSEPTFRYTVARSRHRDKCCVTVTLSGVMDEDAATEVIRDFEAALPIEPFVMRANLRELERYEAAARAAWTESLKQCRDQIECIVIVGARPLVRMAAATVAMLIRIPIEFEE